MLVCWEVIIKRTVNRRFESFEVNGSRWKKTGLKSLGDFFELLGNKEYANIFITDYRCLLYRVLFETRPGLIQASFEGRSLFQSFIPYFLAVLKYSNLIGDALYYSEFSRQESAWTTRRRNCWLFTSIPAFPERSLSVEIGHYISENQRHGVRPQRISTCNVWIRAE